MATVDHKTPLSRKGDHALPNLVAACRNCNSTKTRKTEEEFVQYLKELDAVRKSMLLPNVP